MSRAVSADGCTNYERIKIKRIQRYWGSKTYKLHTVELRATIPPSRSQSPLNTHVNLLSVGVGEGGHLIRGVGLGKGRKYSDVCLDSIVDSDN